MKKIFALILAVMMMAAMMSTAFAATGAEAFAETATVNVTVNGIMAGDIVYFFKLGTPSVDEHNEMTITWTPAEVEALMDNETENGYDPSKPLQAGIASLIAQGKINVAPGQETKQSAEATGTSVTTALAPGYYLAFVRQGEASQAAMVIYQNMLINAIPEADSETGTWKTHADITVEVKKTTENIEKTQFDPVLAKQTAQTVDGYKFGDYIPFEITTTIPSYPANAKVATFEISDTPTGLRIVDETVGTGEDAIDHTLKLYVENTDVTANKTTTVNTDAADETFKITVADGNMKIVFDKEYILAHPGQSVKVTYFAELLGNDNEIEYDETNNTAKIKYNENPNDDTTYEPPTTIKQKTYNFTLLKYNEGDADKNPLVGASFSLWDQEEGGNKIALKLDHTEDGKEVYRPIKDGETADEYIVATDGTATVVGLAKGTYYIQEDIAPANFTKMEGRQAVVVNQDSSTAEIDVEIPNKEGSTLPETGGVGTTIFYVVGSLLVLGAAVLLVTKRRSTER